MTEQPSLSRPAELDTVAPADGADRRARATLLFVRMWALAHIIHLTASTGARLDSPWNITVVVAAVVLLLRPAAGAWLAVLACAQLVDMVVEMPFSPDHWMLMTFVNLAILVTMVARRSTGPAALEAAFPAARVIVLIAYSSAALAKWNTTFFDPVLSCADAIAGAASYGLAGTLDVGPLWVITVLACETSIPILLAIPRTRRHGVRLALAFHFTLSASPAFAVVDFTATLYALFLLFLSDRDIGNVLDRIRAVTSRSAIVRDANRKPWVTAALGLAVIGFAGYLSARAGAGFVLLGSEIYLLSMLLAVLLAWRSSRDTRPFGKPLWVQVPVIVLVALWASGPYLGLRTTGVFTMFSGLRTEGPSSNHLFLPTVHLTDWQDDVVVIESSNDPGLSEADGGVVEVPLMALRRLATDDPGLVVTGRLHGETVTFGPGPGQRRLEPLSGWEYKFLHFRPVAAGDQPFCSMS